MNKDRSSLARYAPHVRESLFRNPGNFKPFLEFRIRESFASGIQNPGLWNPE